HSRPFELSNFARSCTVPVAVSTALSIIDSVPINRSPVKAPCCCTAARPPFAVPPCAPFPPWLPRPALGPGPLRDPPAEPAPDPSAADWPGGSSTGFIASAAIESIDGDGGATPPGTADTGRPPLSPYCSTSASCDDGMANRTRIGRTWLITTSAVPEPARTRLPCLTRSVPVLPPIGARITV